MHERKIAYYFNIIIFSTTYILIKHNMEGTLTHIFLYSGLSFYFIIKKILFLLAQGSNWSLKFMEDAPLLINNGCRCVLRCIFIISRALMLRVLVNASI